MEKDLGRPIILAMKGHGNAGGEVVRSEVAMLVGLCFSAIKENRLDAGGCYSSETAV